MNNCKFSTDGVCCNNECPACGQYCPVIQIPNICKHEKRYEDNVQEFLNIVEGNPNLPIVPMVDYEVVGEDWGRWMGSFGHCHVGEYALFNDRFYEDREDFTEDYYDRNSDDICEMFDYHPQWELPHGQFGITNEQLEQNKIASANVDKYLEEKADEYFHKAIIVWIGTPKE